MIKKQIHTQNFDLLIVGGGLTGLPLAIACGAAGLRVAIVDTAEPDSVLNVTFDGRVSALNRATCLMMEQLGVWPLMKDQAQPIKDIRVVDGDAPTFLHFDHTQGVPETEQAQSYGFMVENRVLRKALDVRVRALTADVDGPITRFAPDALVSLSRTSDAVHADLKSGAQIRAPLVAAADGRNSRLRQEAGIECHGWSYGQTGIILAMYHDKPHDGLALERFRTGGPFAVLPMVDDANGRHQSGIVWCEESPMADHILALDDAAFTKELKRRVGNYLGDLKPHGPRWSYPLALNHAKQYTQTRMALVGDAAHAMHPVAGQGLNLGLRDVATLAQLIVDTRRVGLDIGQDSVLARYDQSRRFDSLALMGMTDGLTRLFSTDNPAISSVRKMGLGLVEQMTPVKTFFTRHATRGSGSARTARLLQGIQL